MLSIDCYHFTPNTGIPLASYEDIVDGDVNELDEEADESHDTETHTGGLGDSHKFLPVGLGALLHEVHGILRELAERLDGHLVKSFFTGHFLVFQIRTVALLDVRQFRCHGK